MNDQLLKDPYFDVGVRHCLWCRAAIRIVRRPGRPRLYCRQSCRQRAYERRSGSGVLPPVERRSPFLTPSAERPRTKQPAYEQGHVPGHDARLHALRLTGQSDHRGRRSTLCGVLAAPTNHDFSPAYHSSCATCSYVAAVRRPKRPTRVSADLASLRDHLDSIMLWSDRQRRPGLANIAGLPTATDLLHRLLDVA
jgi:hypothetical protein